mgnify:FL=1
MESKGRRLHFHRKSARIATLALIVPMMVLGFSVRALAGDINGEEARVIAAASGTFYYNNEAYAAKPEYISQLTGYLAQDDVDLSASQADAAISQMYGSIAQGVSEGYLYKLSDAEDTTEETTEENTTEATTETTKPPIMVVPTEEAATEAENPESDVKEDGSTGESAGMQTTEAVIQQIDEEEADGKVTYDVEHHTIIYENKDGSEKKELPSVNHPLDVTNYVRVGNIVIYTMLGIILLLVLGLYLGKCFPWQRKKRNRKTARYYVNHKMRSAYRKITGTVYMVIIAAHVMVGVLLLGVGASVFRQSFVIDNLTSSGYYRYVYDDMNQAIQRELADQNAEAVDTMMQQVGYDTFLNAAKQQAKSSLSGTIQNYDGSELQQKLMEMDCGLSGEAQQTCANVIVGNVQSYSTDMVGSSIYGIKQGYWAFMKQTLPIMAVNMLLMVVIVILMDRYHHRGVRYIARGVIAGAVITLLFAIGSYVMKPYAKIYMQPSSLYLFMRDYAKHAAMIVGAIASMAVLVGVLLMTLVGVVRKRQMEDE